MRFEEGTHRRHLARQGRRPIPALAQPGGVPGEHVRIDLAQDDLSACQFIQGSRELPKISAIRQDGVVRPALVRLKMTEEGFDRFVHGARPVVQRS